LSTKENNKINLYMAKSHFLALSQSRRCCDSHLLLRTLSDVAVGGSAVRVGSGKLLCTLSIGIPTFHCHHCPELSWILLGL
jgi:hypothetical protein